MQKIYLILQIRSSCSLGILIIFLKFIFKLFKSILVFFKLHFHFFEFDKLRVFFMTKLLNFFFFLSSSLFDSIFCMILHGFFNFRSHFYKDVGPCRDFLKQDWNFLVRWIIKHFISLQLINGCQNIFFVLAIFRQKLELELSNSVKSKLVLVFFN